MGFLDEMKEKIIKLNNGKLNEFKEPLDRLNEDGDQPWGWHYINKDYLDAMHEYYSYFLNIQVDSMKKLDIEAEYEATLSLINCINELKDFCLGINECFVEWWNIYIGERLLARKIERLNYINDNLDTLLKEQALRIENKKFEELQLPIVKEQVLEIIKNESGILQKDIYNRIEPPLSKLVGYALSILSKEGKIQKVSIGRTYALYIKNEGC